MLDAPEVPHDLSVRRPWRLVGAALVAAAVVAFLFPTSYPWLQTVGTMDNRTLDAAGYEDRRGGGPVDAPRLKAGDEFFGAIMSSNQAAAQNKNAADRRGLALLLAVPGMYLLGATSKRRLR
jgi:hypothetical protein